MRARFAIVGRASGWLASAVQRVSRRTHDTEIAARDLGSIDLSPIRVPEAHVAIVERTRRPYHSRSSPFTLLRFLR
jgi:hypothetical protein